jgi:hypothetical protein
VTECNYRIEFALQSAALDASALRVLREVAPRSRNQRSARIHAMIAPGEAEGLMTARYASIRDELLRAGVRDDFIQSIRVYDLLPDRPPRANVNVCAPWESPMRRRRSEPEDPLHLIEYRFRDTLMRIPLALLGPYVWNDVPLEQPPYGPTLYLARQDGDDVPIPAIRQCAEGPDRDAACRGLIRVTLQPWLWTPELDPPGYRLPSDGSNRPSTRARASYTVARSRHPPGPANYFASFTLRDGQRVIAEGGCSRPNIVARADASAFVGDGEAQCTFRMLRISPEVGASLAFNIDNLDEVPATIERAREALQRFMVSAPPT